MTRVNFFSLLLVLLISWASCACSQDTPPTGPQTASLQAATSKKSPIAERHLSDLNAEEVSKPVFKFELSRSVVYRKTKTFELTCDIYRPVGKGPFPAILAVHGGAWRQGTKLALMRHAWMMASSGFVVVAINYRHAPQYPFPAQVEDCKHAVRWMKSNASIYDIDADRIGAFGYSAGGHLVAMLGTTDSEDGLEGSIEPGLENQNSRVKAVAAGAAPCEFEWLSNDSSILAYWLGGSRAEDPAAYRIASPTTYISPDDPPFYFFHGESDLIVPVESTLKMHRSLVDSGVSSRHDIAKSSGHIMTFSDLRWMKRAINFFDSHLMK